MRKISRVERTGVERNRMERNLVGKRPRAKGTGWKRLGTRVEKI